MQFILFLMCLRLNLSVEELGYRFEISSSLVSRIFLNVLDVMFQRLSFLVKWPSHQTLWETTPMCFCKHFKTKVCIIIDCFEVFINRPANLDARARTFSAYKHHNTVKFLLGMSPQGTIAYISKAYGGRTSDTFLTEDCEILRNLLPGDVLMATRGFDIGEDAAVCFAEVKIPAFTKGKKQLSALDVEKTRKIANVRIHVVRISRLLRRKYKLLQSTLPLDILISVDDRNMCAIDKIVHVYSYLTNVCSSVIPFE